MLIIHLKYFYFILLSLAADEADGGATCPDPADRQVGRAAAARPARAPRLRAQRRPPRHQATRRGVRKPQGKCGELIDIYVMLDEFYDYSFFTICYWH